jgi:hypothetical protein
MFRVGSCAAIVRLKTERFMGIAVVVARSRSKYVTVAKGVVTSIQVAKVSASTADQAKSIVENSLKSGWKK